jgi:hypothetical protein
MGKKAAKLWAAVHRPLSVVASEPTVLTEDFTLKPLRANPPPVRSSCCSQHAGHSHDSDSGDIETGEDGEASFTHSRAVMAVTMDRE